jgi:hypothetical protein
MPGMFSSAEWTIEPGPMTRVVTVERLPDTRVYRAGQSLGFSQPPYVIAHTYLSDCLPLTVWIA